jgi:hypothetical protein
VFIELREDKDIADMSIKIKWKKSL